VIYAAGLCSMFFTSATYHRWVHTLRARRIWRRADHAMIFAAIAGSFTPICLLAVPDRFGVPLLVLMWVGGFAGMTMKVAGWRHAPRVGGVMYIALGWVGVVAIPQIWSSAGVWPAVLVLVGGVSYTTGALWLLRGFPTLRPHVFSYHEVWHLWTVVAAAAHFVAVWMIVV
jgi:hemolysin III